MGDELEQDTLYVYEILITMKIFPHLKRTIFFCASRNSKLDKSRDP